MKNRSLTPSAPLAVLGFLIAALTGCDGDRAPTEATVRPGLEAELVANVRTTVDTVVFDDCVGEDIALIGKAHVVFSITQSDGAGLHLNFKMNQVLSGTGLSTGKEYRSISTSATTLNLQAVPFEQTAVSSFRLLGRGAGGDLLVHFLQHITVDALGNLRVFNSDSHFECT